MSPRSTQPDAAATDGIDFHPLKRSADGSLCAWARVAVQSPWFRGHFPAAPILPGIAQIALAERTLRAGADRQVRVTGVRRVRFKRVVHPEERIDIRVAAPHSGAGEVAFTERVGPAVVCTGWLLVV
jgi:3-hydroxymyristoyl/3-hydroxydecanoyl-(acyl carrier protein) dehydratase